MGAELLSEPKNRSYAPAICSWKIFTTIQMDIY